MKANIPPFTPGQKVVCKTNKVDEFEEKHSGTIVNKKYIVLECLYYSPTNPDWWIKVNGLDRWVKAKRFRPIQEQTAPLLTFEKIKETEKEEILIMN